MNHVRVADLGQDVGFSQAQKLQEEYTDNLVIGRTFVIKCMISCHKYL